MSTNYPALPDTLAAAREQRPDAVHPPEPEVSIITPALNEEAYVLHTLQQAYRAACAHVAAGGTFEMLVVDNGSTDATGQIAEDFGACVILEEKRGHAQARNTGIDEAKGKIVLWADADVIRVSEQWVMTHLEQYRDPNVIAVSGPSRLVGTHWAFAIVRGVFNWLRRRDPELAYDPQSGWEGAGNVSFRKDVLEQVGVYDTEIKKGEDIDLWKRLKAHAREHGKRVLHAPDDKRMLMETSGRRYDTLMKVLWELWDHLRQLVWGKTKIKAADRR